MSVSDDRRALNGARVVDHDIEPAEGRDGLLDRVFHLRLVAHIDHQGQRVAAGFGDLVGGGEDGARQLRMRLVGLGGNGDVGAVARGAERNCKPDAARCAGDEERVVFKGHDFDSHAIRIAVVSTRFLFPIWEGDLPRATVGQNL